MSTKNLHGIIFNIFDYKENDLIVDVVCLELGFIQLYVKGGQKLTTKSFYVLKMFNIIEFDINKNQPGLLNYRGGRVLQSFDYTNLAFDKMNVVMLISELLVKLKNEVTDVSNIYQTLEKVIVDLSNDVSNYDLINLFINQVLSILGIGLTLDCCLNCGIQTNIIAYSWDNHGFVCADCIDNGKLVYDKDILNYLYYLNKNKYYDISEGKKKIILQYLLELLNENAGIYLKSLRYLFKEDL